MGWFGNSRNSESEVDYSSLVSDLHSHILPGIDDGAHTVEESADLIRALMSIGFRKFVATPHIMADHFPNTPDTIRQSLSLLQQHLTGLGQQVPVVAAAEYYVDFEFSDRIREQEVMCFGDRYVLLELPVNYPPHNLQNILFELQTGGFKPVLAHPERYGYWYGDTRQFTDLCERDVLLQVNLHSFGMEPGHPIRKMAEKLAQLKLIRFVGSDTHNIRNLDYLRLAFRNRYLTRLLGSGLLLNPSL